MKLNDIREIARQCNRSTNNIAITEMDTSFPALESSTKLLINSTHSAESSRIEFLLRENCRQGTGCSIADTEAGINGCVVVT